MLKQILCKDTDFWSDLNLVEELLRPLKTAILAIEGSIVEACKAYMFVSSAFEECIGVAWKFFVEQEDEIKEVNIALDFVIVYLFLDFECASRFLQERLSLFVWLIESENSWPKFDKWARDYGNKSHEPQIDEKSSICRMWIKGKSSLINGLILFDYRFLLKSLN